MPQETDAVHALGIVAPLANQVASMVDHLHKVPIRHIAYHVMHGLAVHQRIAFQKQAGLACPEHDMRIVPLNPLRRLHLGLTGRRTGRRALSTPTPTATIIIASTISSATTVPAAAAAAGGGGGRFTPGTASSRRGRPSPCGLLEQGLERKGRGPAGREKKEHGRGQKHDTGSQVVLHFCRVCVGKCGEYVWAIEKATATATSSPSKIEKHHEIQKLLERASPRLPQCMAISAAFVGTPAPAAGPPRLL